MHHLVDGYNYLHRARLFDRRDLEGARSRLARRLGPLLGRGDAVTIFWDARGRLAAGFDRDVVEGVEMIYCRDVEGADGAIRARLRAAADVREIRVITDDADVARPAKQLGAEVASVAAAEAEVLGVKPGRRPSPAPPSPRALGRTHRAPRSEDDDDEKPAPPTRVEIAEWLRYFGVNDGEDGERPKG